MVLNQVLEVDKSLVDIKEVCLAIYVKMATDVVCNIVIVLESDLI